MARTTLNQPRHAARLNTFTHPDPAMRQPVIDIGRRGLDTLRAMGERLMTLWMVQEGVDHSFRGDCGRIRDETIARLQTVCGHDPGIDIAIE